MPTYEYVCDACGHELEVFQSMSAAPKRKCPACGKQRLQRRIGRGAGILFKGTGFYQTDYRSDSYRKGAEKAGKDGGAGASPSKSPDGAASKGESAPKSDPGPKTSPATTERGPD